MKRFILFLSPFTPVSLFLAGCGGKPRAKRDRCTNSEHQLTIYTTVYPLQYFTEVIGGNCRPRRNNISTRDLMSTRLNPPKKI